MRLTRKARVLAAVMLRVPVEYDAYYSKKPEVEIASVRAAYD